MSELRWESWTMPAADLGPESPLPAFQLERDIHAAADNPDLPDDMRHNIGYGRLPNTLPYTTQNGYSRVRYPRDFRVAVLENDLLKATFLLEMGGRLWSLLHKPTGRELLSVNPVFQPANLAIRNAWFSGGVEWNIGTIGHTPLTCDPLFAARLHLPDGTPVLRLYEWERMRGVPYQIDAYLPDGSPVLFVHVRITNPHPQPVPMYWWSNMAVPESDDTRVLVPAEKAYQFNYWQQQVDIIPVPDADGQDITYTTRSDRAIDYFFHIEDDRRHWITALDQTGSGLIQTSTERLRGRKLFLWGTGSGGRRWQEFLSVPGQSYLEIQAGLARTQLEHVPMPPHTEWRWLEAYGLLQSDAATVQDTNWSAAVSEVETRLEALLPAAVMQAEFERCATMIDQEPDEVFQRGAGWGALENLRRAADGESPFCTSALVFDEGSLGVAQQPWLQLLREGTFPQAAPDAVPDSYMVQAEWRTRMEKALHAQPDSGWLAWLHLGVMRHYAGDVDGARAAWEQSHAQQENPWALRNLALLARAEGDLEQAAALYQQAHHLRPGLLPLTIEMGRALIDAGQPAAWLDLLAVLPADQSQHGRLRLLEGEAALALGDYARIQRVFDDHVTVADLREGEKSLSQLWFDYHTRRLSETENIPINDALRARVQRDYPLPPQFDFRMVIE